MTRKLVFVSYARPDEPEQPGEGVRWLTFVLGYLKAAFVGAEVDIFTDRGLAGGADWSAEIERRLRTCDAFVLLVSPHSMTSPFVVKKEIALVRAREAAGDAPLFVPILLSPTPEAALDLIRDRNWRPRGDKTLWDYPPPERARKMMEAAQEIAREVKGRERKALVIEDRKALKAWLEGQPREVAVAIAARAALRVAPRYRPRKQNFERTSDLTVAVFRATALARAAGKYPARANELRAAAAAAFTAAAAAAAASASASAASASASADAAASAASASASADAAASAAAAFTASAASASADAAASAAAAFTASAAAVTWRAVTADAALVLAASAAALADSPLWPGPAPDWVDRAWADMRNRLAADEDWDVWFDWYEDRLRGVSRSEAYELTFATVPEEVWQQGAKAANAWIRAHLPPASPPPDLPPPVEDAESPADFAWDEARLIEQIAGVAQAPLFEHEASPGDQAQTLAAARAACDWLLKLLATRLHNVGPFYALRIEAIRDALPLSASQGAILIAYNHALTLREKLIADDGVPDEVRSDAIRIVESVFALCRFYPEVERHMVGVARMKDVDLLSTAALRGFARAVRGAPGVFGASVAAGLDAVEALGPEGPSPAPQPAPAIPAPPQTPPADRSADRLKAGWVNALYKTFREGPAVVGASDAWIEAAHKVGAAAKPILDWLARSAGG